MARLPPKPRDALSEEQRTIHDKFYLVATTAFVGPSGPLFKWQEENGAQTGPMPFFMYHPKPGAMFAALSLELAQLPLPQDARETAIITVTAAFKAEYPLHSHIEIAANANLLSRDQLEMLRKGEKPQGLNKGCSVARDIAKQLSQTPGPMPQDLWDRSVSVLGKDATVSMLHFVEYYTYVSMFMNACDVRVSE